MKKLRKLLAVVLSIAMVLGMTNFSFAANEELPDLVLDGGEEGGSSMIKTLSGKNDKYKWQGFVSFLDMVPEESIEDGNYRYLVMTYTGDITKIRFEFVHGAGTDDEELEEIKHWFDKENVTDENGEIIDESDVYFVSADGEPFTLVGDNTTLVIDLLESNVDLGYYNSGLHMHSEEMLTRGNVVISNAYLTNTIPEVDDPVVTEPETEEPVVTEPATEEPVETEPATTPETEPEVEPASDIIVLDDGTDGGFCGLSLSSEKDGYQYGGYVYLKDATADYKYLQLTYTGSLLNTRFEIEGNGTYWFDTWQTDKFVDVDGNDIDTSYSDEARTVVIDLEKSNVELGWGNDCHIHTENLLSNGGVSFIYGCLTTTPDVVEVPSEPEEPASDIIVLDDGTDGAFCGLSLSSEKDGYQYGGYVYLKDATADYKYLQLTYTGSLLNTRFEIEGNGTYWFDTWQTEKFVDVDGNDIDTSYSDEARTVVIDLEKSNVELGWGNDCHIHTENLLSNGGITFIYGCLTKTPEVVDVPEQPSEPEEPELPDEIILDEGDNDGLVGHELSSTADGYAYGGYVYLKGATAEYKYLEITYTGSLANTRFEIVNDGTYWFDTWQTDKFVDVDGNDIDTSYSDEERTIVIDLEKSGAELGKGDGMHIHTENLASNGGVTFIEGKLLKTAPVVLPEVIVLDAGDNGGLVGHELSSTADGYAYGGYVYLKGATTEYKYLEITYTGSLANTRFEIINDGTYWFDTWQTDKFVDVDGNDIDTSYSDAERTIVIDLEKSGVELGKGDGMHIHTENLASNGGVNFADGRLYKTYTAPAEPVDMAVSVVLENDLSVNFKVPAADLASYTNPAVVVTMNGKETVLTDYTVVDDMYVFTFEGINAAQMGDTISAVLTADEGVLSEKEFSISEYAVKAFDNTEDEELKTLLVDMLNYGAETQIYAGYNTDNLANAVVTDEMAAYATTETPALSTIKDAAYETVNAPSVVWKSVALVLDKSPIVRFKIVTEDIEGLSAVIKVGSTEVVIDSSEFEATDGGYYVYVDALYVTDMRTPIYATAYNGSTAVSNTLRYSVESYAYSKQNSENLGSLVEALMKYSDSVCAYAAK